MENTGERHIIQENITDEAEFYNHLMHIATYQYAEKYVRGKRVLDYGCGSGYGSYTLSLYAEHVTAVDISEDALEFAKNTYKNDNITFCKISDLDDTTFDVITSFQVIEHVSKASEYLEKLKSLLNPNGCLILSTPDKQNRLFNLIQKPWNIYHLKEYSNNSLRQLLSAHFNSVEIVKIGSIKEDLIMKEIARTKKQMIITLPCTLIIYPNSLRLFLLKTQVKIYKSLLKLRNTKPGISTENKAPNHLDCKFSTNDIEFDNSLKLSTDLLAICKNN